jgi:hypothetical protein
LVYGFSLRKDKKLTEGNANDCQLQVTVILNIFGPATLTTFLKAFVKFYSVHKTNINNNNYIAKIATSLHA